MGIQSFVCTNLTCVVLPSYMYFMYLVVIKPSGPGVAPNGPALMGCELATYT